MARKTREESLNTKNRILDAAELVLLEKGVGQTAMADIAEAAGMSRGAVYGHFNGKIEVCVAVCDRAFSRAVEGFDLSDERPALATLRLAASHYLHQCGEPGSMQRVLEILYMKCEQSEENAPLMRRRSRCPSSARASARTSASACIRCRTSCRCIRASISPRPPARA